MSRAFSEATAPQRAVRRIAASGPGSWLFSRVLDRLDRLTFRVTKGRHLMVEGRRWRFRAVEVEDERRERIWQEALRAYPGFSAYARRAAPRRISVFVLEPEDAA